jgi:regulator of sigma E protease
VHELGHFLAAKACGVKCEKFYIGFDVPIRLGPIQFPRVLFRRKVGETEYGIGIVPLGGYVKMLGQDDNPANAAKEAERIRVAREQSSDGSDLEPQTNIDPRSYPAKSVPQRLLIISAGVVMNLIFAVIFGMVAYRVGVSYTPCLVGSTSPGLSAWEVGLQSGDRIIQLGRDGILSDHLRFDKDMTVTVMMTGANRELDLLVQPRGTPAGAVSAAEWTTVRLSNPQEELHGRPIIGISPFGSTEVILTDELQEALGHLTAMQAQPALQAGDIITAVNGQPVEDYVQLSIQLARRVDEPLQLTVQRIMEDSQQQPTTQTLEVVVPPQPLRWLGLEMQIGPIASVQRGSPAELAGLLPGDRITHVDGQPVKNPMTLPHRLRRMAGQDVKVSIVRGESAEPITLSVPLRQVNMFHTGMGLGDALASEALGVAFTIENQVVSVADGTPAAAGGMLPGDVIEQVQFLPASPEDADRERAIFGGETIADLSESPQGWLHVEQRIQLGLPETKVRLTYSRDDSRQETELMPANAPGWFVADRGLKLTTAEEVHKEPNWSRAWQLGLRETRESIRQVYFILFRLISGQMSATNLGGPAAIATMAGMEAHAGIPRLLVFLTLLSANLAVINFLPIPVLDGGHAMFLLYEGIFRRPVNERVAFGLTMAGFCFILGLMLFVIGLDVWRLSGLAG